MFYIDNISSETLKIYAENENFTSRAKIDYDEVQIEGRDRSIFIEKNYLEVEGETTIYALTDNLDVLYSLFTGKHTLRVNDREVDIYFYDALETFAYSSKYAFTVNYLRGALWSKYDDDYIKVEASIINKGTIKSKPIIKLIGTANSDVDITIAGVRFVYHFDEDNEVVIDCDLQEETFNGISKSKNIEIGFEYPILKVGTNKVEINSGSCEIYIKRKDVWL